jgi:hypothetical protein
MMAGSAGAVANLIPYAWIGVAPASAVAAGIFQNRVNRALAAAEVPDGAGGTTTLAQAEGAEGQRILRAEADRRREYYLDTGNGNTTGGIDILRGTVAGLEATTQEQRTRNRTRVLGAAATAGVISMIPPVVRNV